MTSNQDAARTICLRESTTSESEPWRQLEASVANALVRLKASHWPGGQAAQDTDGCLIAVWQLPPIPEANGLVGFDAEGRLLGYARRIDRWYEWYKDRAPNSWMFFSSNVNDTATLFIKNWVDRLAR